MLELFSIWIHYNSEFSFQIKNLIASISVATVAPQLAEVSAIGSGTGAVSVPVIGGSGISVPSVSLGGGGVISSKPTSFWDRLTTLQGNPVLQLTGIWVYDKELVWKVIFSVFFLYVGIILFIDGRYITNTIIRAVTRGRGMYSKFLSYIDNKVL